MLLIRRLLSIRRCLLGGLVTDGLERRLCRLGRGRGKPNQPILSFIGLGRECIELLQPIGRLQLRELREVASTCQGLGQAETQN